jgi:hypothetical protein
MTLAKAIDLLYNSGYRKEKQTKETEWYFYKRSTGSDCRLNERPPSFGVTLYELPVKDELYTSMKINLRAEAMNGQWVDLGYYSCPLSQLEHLSDMEFTIEKMWECAN